ncbi:hypothetical protein D9756_009952 [Leucocoprinus leucothites]|uniref:Abscisic acid G-protein coupled receptor-domain-containing protein n=1 Tax=Leucocoprinus leucothites TaxID=201217 RepID=A0A8H5FSD7_9AGAR|nr:hypothetical protein D9756_009952 [Leucoagaricus leucothites]
MSLFLALTRPVLLAACLYLLPHAILEPTSDNAGVLPTPTSATTNKAVAKKDWRPMLARTIFAWTFTESSMLFVLLICQATSTFSSSQRAANFQFSLYALLAIHVILIPQSIALLVLSPTPANLLRSPRTILSSFIPVLLSLILLSYIPSFTTESHPPFLSRTLSRLIVLGTTILGLLSGFGAVTRAWDYLPSSTKKECNIVPTEEEIRSTETSLQSVQNDLQKKQDELARRAQGSPSPADGSASTTASWMKRMGDTLRGGDDLTLEIKGLQTLYSTLSLTLQSQRAKLASSKRAKTLQGRLASLIGRLFAGYCVFRTFTAGYNTLFFRSSPRSQSQTTYPDIVTSILIWLLVPTSSSPELGEGDEAPLQVPVKAIYGFELTPASISSLTRHISLLLIGLIVLSSIGLVMRGVNRALKVTSKTLGTSLIVLVLSYLMGIYLLSTLVQLRSSFPPPPLTPTPNDTLSTPSSSSSTSEVIVPINLFSLIPPWELFNSLFDLMFLVAAVGTAGVRWSVDRLGMVE